MVITPDPQLARLMAAERAAYQRFERLRGFPADVQAIAQELWVGAREALRAYRQPKG